MDVVLSILRHLGGRSAHIYDFGDSATPYTHIALTGSSQEILVLAAGDDITLFRLALPAR